MKKIYFFLLALFAFASCAKEVSIPQNATPVKEVAGIYPDYRDITIPPNIAPLKGRQLCGSDPRTRRAARGRG